ncbi:MAG: hypothetical protein KDJ88_18605 [Bauldia sp.]|nr:hypothetical protein [Bauldia sp.]
MARPEDFDAAVAAGIITADQARQLATFLAAQAGTAEVPETPTGEAAVAPVAAADIAHADEEEVRFIRGFQDVFMTIGVALFLVGIGIAGPMVAGPLIGTYAGAVVAFLLALGLTRRRRLVLPSIALAIGFTLFAGVGTAILIGGNGWDVLLGGWDVHNPGRIRLIAGFAALLASGLFYAVFRLPFALALVALSAGVVVFGAAGMVVGEYMLAPWRLPIVLAIGLVIFAVAMAFDLSDPGRRTMRADNAFWLHLVAAPMIVHATIGLVIADGRTFTASEAFVVVAVVLAIGVVAVAIDRRALLVAGLGYLAYAVAILMAEADMTATGVIATTLVLVGAFVLTLGAGWRPVRHAVIGILPARGLVSLLPPA